MRCVLVVVASLLPILSAPDAEARRDGAPKSVKACSQHGNGCLVAPVRQGRFGLEAQLKSGTWIPCRGDCREAIREDVLDFWETQSDRALAIGR
ncbi:hypothetical protein [Hyphomicrobium sp.]|uniref:hypothetical protein n=1 Tax=Hyphomicrobium sp. TaxID=82 RepID=UPI002C866D73|nr:hypothetical protein [Hyphomicrobium sp.]HRN88271.1 hypothetical protein [Hyphomicrobium sp.]HRQ27865.1 hypothetical protein [Hyphomicrobium sp.]